MRTPATLFSLAAFAAISNAQVPAGSYTWQVSSDNGATWSGMCVGTAGSTIKVRLLASWTVIPPVQGVAYAGGQFNATLMGADAGDVVSNTVRPASFNFASQTFVASAISGGTKIDTTTDVLEPGLGTGWVNPGQSDFFQTPLNTDNPVVISKYDVLCGSQNQITIGSVVNRGSGRAMPIYSIDFGSQVRLPSSPDQASIRFSPIHETLHQQHKAAS